MKRCAVFSCMGLGDGLISLVLSNNLQLNGYLPVTFHPFLSQLQTWFPCLPIRPFEGSELFNFDHYFIFFEKSPWMQEVIAHCQKHFPDKTTILNPIATPHRDYPYWENGKFDGRRPFVDNLYRFCQEGLGFKVATKSNGIVPPPSVMARRYPKRVIFHPSSSREGKNWTKEKYLELAKRLSEKGYSPLFLLTKEERQGWDLSSIDVLENSTLAEMAKAVCESGSMIGNDSGIGHLASCLGVPTVTICRSKLTACFWRPAWARGAVLTPSSWIPNLKGLRLRDQHWKKWISVPRVLREFEKIATVE